MKNIARGVILANHVMELQKLKKLPWKIIAGNLVIQLGNKNYDSDEESPSSGEERRRRRRNMKLKTIALIEESLKKKIVQMRPPVKLRTFKKLLLHLQKDN